MTIAKRTNRRLFGIDIEIGWVAIRLMCVFCCGLLMIPAECQGMEDAQKKRDSSSRAQELWKKIKTAGRREYGQETVEYWF